MADFELVMPRMGESILEATILRWLKKEGDTVEEDETILEIATDKVDSEVPSPVEGVLGKILYQEGASVAVGEVIAIIKSQSESPRDIFDDDKDFGSIAPSEKEQVAQEEKYFEPVDTAPTRAKKSGFLSPLVRNIAKRERISPEELLSLEGSGLQGKITKQDILSYVSQRNEIQRIEPLVKGQIVELETAEKSAEVIQKEQPTTKSPATETSEKVTKLATGSDEIVEMTRMRKLIAQHMINSRDTSVHVTSYVEADVSNIWDWREKHKAAFAQRNGFKLTFMPLIIDAVVQALQEFPQINASVQDDKIIIKKNVNIGIAAALADGNLIVPVLKNANHYNITGLGKQLHGLISKARGGTLAADDINGGTFTISNIGTFGNIMGTPIINQPEVAILAVGAIRKLPAVVETSYGDLIAIRKKMFLSLSYDHRVVDGMLGGSFLKKIADKLEGFDQQRTI